ncbi:MAG: WbuC family cupin fold metalloprotein [Alphaproteobacteria bacterium]
MSIHEINSETSYIKDKVSPAASKRDLSLLLQKYKQSPRNRHRFCFHQGPNVDLHDIIICYDHKTYIPPNKHIGKAESLLVISGTLDFFLFNDSGLVYDYRRLSTCDSEYPFYIRVPPNTWHGLRAVGPDPCMIKETISGPYDKSTLHWAAFAPSEADGHRVGFEWYDSVYRECETRHISAPSDEVFEKVTELVFRSSRQLVTVSLSQLKPILEAASKSSLKRARVCCHGGSEEKLQEMFIALFKDVNIEESMHLRKDESLTVISGSGRYVFPNEDGSVRETVSLTSLADNDNDNDTSHFYARINRYVPHKIIVDSEVMIIHEATTGPFSRSDTDFRIKRFDQ